MSLISKNNTFTSGNTIVASEHNDNFDTIYNAFNGNITNANIKPNAAIADSKLAQITTASKVHGTSLTGLASTPSGAGALPGVNLSALMPVGTIYANGAVATNPATLFGFGTWVAIEGQCVVGLVAGGEFDTLGAVSEGETTHTLTTGEMPAHGHPETYSSNEGAQGFPGSSNGGSTEQHTSDSVGGDGAHNNIQPSYVAYVWIRTV